MAFIYVTALATALSFVAFMGTAQVDNAVEDLDVTGGVELLAQAGDSVVQVDAGLEHACALVQSGRVYCWGENRAGQLGNGSRVLSAIPEKVKRLSDVVQIAVGAYHSCALQNGGRVFCWGENFNGQLGNGTRATSAIRVRVKNVGPARQIAAGDDHTCLLKLNGLAFCWGSNATGKLGIGEEVNPQPLPVRVVGGRVFTHISAGGDNTCALETNGRAFCWGKGSSGQVGIRSVFR